MLDVQINKERRQRMTLGEIISDYCKDHTKAEFVRDSGISKAYVYMLIENKNSRTGEPITPTIDMIRKVAKGMHTSFDEVFNKLDDDLVVHLSTGIATSRTILPKEIANLYMQLTESSKEKVHQMIRDEYEKNKDLITEYQRVIHLKKITSIEDARILLDNTAAFGGVVGDEQLIELANIIRNNHK